MICNELEKAYDKIVSLELENEELTKKVKELELQLEYWKSINKNI